MKILINITIYIAIALVLVPTLVFAGPESTNFELVDYGFGSGGVASASSESYLFQGLLGEIETASLSSENYLALPGLTYTLQPNLPWLSTFSNPSNWYNKLSLVINNANNPSDTLFAIQISSGSATFSSNVYYIQSGSNTLGTSIGWQTYSTWGSGSGITLAGLTPGTTYYARVAAKRGVFTQGPWGPTSSAATINPTLTFSINTTSQPSPPFSVNIGTLTVGSVTTSSDKITANITTNANSGGLLYVYDTNAGLKSTTAGNYTISAQTADLSSVQEGYGIRGTTTSGAPMQLISPYNGAGSNVGLVDTQQRAFADSSAQPVTSGSVSFELKAKAKATTPYATDYSDILTVIATGSF